MNVLALLLAATYAFGPLKPKICDFRITMESDAQFGFTNGASIYTKVFFYVTCEPFLVSFHYLKCICFAFSTSMRIKSSAFLQQAVPLLTRGMSVRASQSLLSCLTEL